MSELAASNRPDMSEIIARRAGMSPMVDDPGSAYKPIGDPRPDLGRDDTDDFCHGEGGR